MSRRLALVFGGGGSKGAFGAGVLWGLLDRYPTLRWHVVSGTSTGALITPFAALVADEPGPPQDRPTLVRLRDLYVTSREDDIVESNLAGGKLLKAIIDLPTGLYNAKPLRKKVKKAFPKKAVKRLAASKVIAIVNAVNLQSGKLALWTQGSHVPALRRWFKKRKGRGRVGAEFFRVGDLYDAMVASSAIPFAIDPVRYKPRGRDQMVDGGVLDLAPLRAAIAAGATDVLAVFMSPRVAPRNGKIADNLLDVGMRAVDHLSDEIGRNDVQVARGVTELRGLAELLLKNKSKLPPEVKAWIAAHPDRLTIYRDRTAVDVEVVEPHKPLGETLDFDSKVRSGWPLRPNTGPKISIMRARFAYGRRRIGKLLDGRPDMVRMVERFVGP